MSANAEDIFYQAYLNQDSHYEGIFFLAVKTTGIDGATKRPFVPKVGSKVPSGRYRAMARSYPLGIT